jgi:hypothetical protein
MNMLGIPLMGIAAALICSTLTLAQVAGGPGVVVTVYENGTATVRIGEEEQTVTLPGAKVGDKVVCTATNRNATWECHLHKD